MHAQTPPFNHAEGTKETKSVLFNIFFQKTAPETNICHPEHLLYSHCTVAIQNELSACP